MAKEWPNFLVRNSGDVTMEGRQKVTQGAKERRSEEELLRENLLKRKRQQRERNDRVAKKQNRQGQDFADN